MDDGGPSEWTTAVAFEVRTRIPRYFKGIREERLDSNANASAYASFLARTFPQDAINLNKYAIVYRYCDQITLPVPNGTSWEEEYEFASSKVRVTATVEEWGMALVACWVVVVTVAQLLVSLVAARKKMPNNVLGEQQILRRWAEENNAREVDREGEAFLSVEDGSKSDRITAILRRVRKRSDDSETVP
ncbi:hypothetical protein FGB62_206g010 [Gracilaria domingensis]|nr:hypothetical protein FGB62_206g010 [Gracilaria domingensis]